MGNCFLAPFPPLPYLAINRSGLAVGVFGFPKPRLCLQLQILFAPTVNRRLSWRRVPFI